MPQIFANNVAGTLAANIGPSDTLILLGSGQGALFPSPSAGQYFYCTLVHVTTGAVEIVQVTSRAVDTLTVVRGRDGTNAISFTTGSVVESRITAQLLRELDWHIVAGVANGVATLDGGGFVPDTQLPANLPRTTAGKLNASVIPDSIATDAEVAAGYLPKANPTSTGLMTVDNLQVDPTGGGAGSLKIGNEAMFYDVNVGDTVGMRSQTNPNIGYMKFGTSLPLGYDGVNLRYGGFSVWHSGNFDPSSKLDVSGGTLGFLAVNGYLLAQSDIQCRRSGAPSNGLIYFGNALTDYLLMDASNWSFGGGKNIFGNDFISTCDRTLKKDRKRRAPTAGISDSLRMFDFTWKNNGMRGRSPMAQDVEKYAPQHVTNRLDVVTGKTTKHLNKPDLALDLIEDLARRVRAVEKENARLRKLLKG